jgi:eIF4-gamma/eIF5/eIF2-epsilon
LVLCAPGVFFLTGLFLLQAAVALKMLYDTDVIEEEVIVAWYDKATAAGILGVPAAAAKAVRDVTKPFVEWLKQDEEDSEEDDEED